MKERLYQVPQKENPLAKEDALVGVLQGEIKHTQPLVDYLDAMGQVGQNPILMVRNSPGGDLSDLLMIKDEMDRVRKQYGVKIGTIAVGWISSAACDLVAWGDKGERVAYPSTMFMMHDIQWKSDKRPNEFASILSRAKEVTDVLKMNRRFEKLMSEATGQPWWKLRKYYEQHITAHKALELGIIDRIELWSPKK